MAKDWTTITPQKKIKLTRKDWAEWREEKGHYRRLALKPRRCRHGRWHFYTGFVLFLIEKRKMLECFCDKGDLD